MSRNYELIEPAPLVHSASAVHIADPILDFTSPQYHTVEQKTLTALERIEALLQRFASAYLDSQPYTGPPLEELITKTKIEPLETPFSKSLGSEKAPRKGRLDGTR